MERGSFTKTLATTRPRKPTQDDIIETTTFQNTANSSISGRPREPLRCALWFPNGGSSFVRTSDAPTLEMVGWLIVGLYPNLIQNAFFSSSVLLVQSAFGKPPRTSSSQFMGQARVLGPEAWVKQRLWSHEPGSSKGSGTICLGQAKVEGAKRVGHTQVEGPKRWDRAQDSRVQL